MSDLEVPSERPDDIGRIQRRDEETISVSISPARFVSLLEEMIGDKEVLSWSREYSFVARLDDLAQFHHLLTEKIKTQSRASMSVFSAEISYSDGSNRAINTFAALERLYEHRDVVALAVSLRWEILVDLGSERPLQRQVVRLDLTTAASRPGSTTTSAAIRIEHTHPLWASEVLAIFEAQLGKIAFGYSNVFRAVTWYRKYLSTGVVALLLVVTGVIAMIYFGSGRAQDDYWNSNEQFVYALSKAVASAEDVKKPEVLAQFTFVLYVLSHPNSELTDSLIGRLRYLDYFGPEMEAVFSQADAGAFKRPVILNSDLRRLLVSVSFASATVVVFTLLLVLYARYFHCPGYLLMTDASRLAHERFLETRNTSREIAYHVLAAALAGSLGRAVVYLYDARALVVPP